MDDGRKHTSTNEIEAFIQKQLSTVGIKRIVSYPAVRDIDEIFSFYPDISINPFAAVMYEGSEYKADPNRTLQFSILVVNKYESDCQTAIQQYLDLLDKVITVLDYQVFNNMKVTVKSDEAARFDKHSMTCSLLVRIQVEDN